MFETFAALAEPNRFRIVELLRTGPQPVGEIGDALGLRQPQVSKHLRVLKDAGLVDVQPAAQQRLYELRGAPLQELSRWLDQYRELWSDRFDVIDDVIDELQRAEAKAKETPKKTQTKKTPMQKTPTKTQKEKP